jgi:arginine decarboxylase
MEHWSASQSKELYRVADWSGGYFDINAAGNVVVKPDPGGTGFDLHQLVVSLRERGIEAPVLFRFDDIIADRTRLVQSAFDEAIAQWEYSGSYRITYPVKVNPLRHVVSTIRDSRLAPRLGFECGSKPELLAILAIHDLTDAPLICNGYKDAEYIELALMGHKLGRQTVIVVEQLYELGQVLSIADQMGVEPALGLRLKPATRGSGLWSSSTGDQAKFGLNTHEILVALQRLRESDRLDCLKLLHFHMGSQIPAINALKKALREVTRMYVEIARLAPGLEILDVGGGLGIDYDGSKSNFEHSVNYTVSEYAEAVVAAIAEACDEADLPHPAIVSESGRAIVAHHAVLVCEVLDVSPAVYGSTPDGKPPSDNPLMERLGDLYQETNLKTLHESLNEAIELRDEVYSRFLHGQLSLEERAYAERVHRHLIVKMSVLARALKYVPEELERLASSIRDTYFCNFSLFQSMLDSWAIDQLFPVMPIQRLNEQPTRKAMLADLTCDCDGVIDRFIDLRDVSDHLLCHTVKDDESYYIGVFLVGAYQEILGGLHNLFGDTNAVHIRFTPEGEPEICNVVHGDTIREVLEYVEYDTNGLLNRFWQSLEKGIKTGAMTPQESARFKKRYREVLEGYTYLAK